MKLVILRAKSNSKAGDKKRYNNERMNFERILFILFIISFSLLVIVQAALTNPTVRTFLTSDNEFQGTPMGVEEYFYDEGTISLRLVNAVYDENLKILVNGEIAAVFAQNVINLEVKDGDIVEIDGSSTQAEGEVEVVSKSDNIVSECVGKKVVVKSNIKKVADIKVKQE
ncbi:MAG: hypothetical protein N2489_08850 [Clostridia bacterium]|nr:hypothetical protein [Clostridia bacterium]